MTEKIQTFSDQVDNLLAGQAVPEDDPLLSLAAEMTPGPALDPSPAFMGQLRRELLASIPPARSFQLRRWSFAGAALTLLLLLALLMVWTPSTLSAAEVLARAADAVAAEPGQIEHYVTKFEIEPTAQGSPDVDYDSIHEFWARVGVTPDGRLTTVESVDVAFRARDVDRRHPVTQLYSTPSKFCFHSYDSSRPLWPGADDEGCITREEPAGNDPGPVAPYAGESFQAWISRMEANVKDVTLRRDWFKGRPVYGLTYTQVVTQSSTFTPADPDDPANEAAVKTLTQERVTYTITLYVDRETFLPAGTASVGPDTIFTQVVRQYEVLDPEDLVFDPFAWPPSDRTGALG